MNPWLERQTIAEDVNTWLMEYRDREVKHTATPQGQAAIERILNGAMDYLNMMMFQAESRSKDEYQETHCEPGGCQCEEERA